jgi:hypothetical protein
VLSVLPTDASLNPEYNAAVAAAVRAAQPFPADMAGTFAVTLARPGG